METIQLNIPTMKSAHCMMTVTNALKPLGGAQVKQMSSGKEEIELNGTTREQVVATIEKAGYQVTNK